MRFFVALGLWLGTASLLQASPFEDQFFGLERSATQDALGGRRADPFAVTGNPAWTSDQPAIALQGTVFDAEHESPSQILAFSAQGRLGERWRVGILGNLPVSSQKILDTGDPDENIHPWLLRSQSLSYWPFFSFRSGNWKWGMALPLYLNADARAGLDLSSKDAQARTQVSLDPSHSYSLGVQWQYSPHWDWSLSYREKQNAAAEAVFETHIPLTSTNLYFAGRSYYLFAPRRITLQSSWDLDAQWMMGLRLRFSQWDRMESPYIKITDSTPSLILEKASFRAKNAWDFSWGSAYRLTERWTLLGSLAYQQSPFSEVPNFADHDQWGLGTGATYEAIEHELQVSAHFRYQRLGSFFYTWSGLGLGYRL